MRKIDLIRDPFDEETLKMIMDIQRVSLITMRIAVEVFAAIKTKHDMLFPIYKSRYYRKKLFDLIEFTFKPCKDM